MTAEPTGEEALLVGVHKVVDTQVRLDPDPDPASEPDLNPEPNPNLNSGPDLNSGPGPGLSLDRSDRTEVTARGLGPEVWHRLLAGAPPIPPIRPGTPVLVAVPHPDDETLGAGGLLHHLAGTGSSVTVVFVTDGSAGYPGCTPAQAAELAEVRRREARAALGALGLPDSAAVFLDVPDGRFGHPGAAEAEAELGARLAALLAGSDSTGRAHSAVNEPASEELSAGAAGPSAGGTARLCLAPWADDPHPDHQAVGRAALTAARDTGTELWQYPIWMRHSIRPDDPIVDVERLRVLRLTPAERAVKRAALETHASQLVSPFAGYGPVLPGHVLDLFADGLEPFFVPGTETVSLTVQADVPPARPAVPHLESSDPEGKDR